VRRASRLLHDTSLLQCRTADRIQRIHAKLSWDAYRFDQKQRCSVRLESSEPTSTMNKFNLPQHNRDLHAKTLCGSCCILYCGYTFSALYFGSKYHQLWAWVTHLWSPPREEYCITGSDWSCSAWEFCLCFIWLCHLIFVAIGHFSWGKKRCCIQWTTEYFLHESDEARSRWPSVEKRSAVQPLHSTPPSLLNNQLSKLLHLLDVSLRISSLMKVAGCHMSYDLLHQILIQCGKQVHESSLKYSVHIICCVNAYLASIYSHCFITHVISIKTSEA